MAQRKSHVKVGDQVLVLSGKDKGKKGEVLQIFLEKERAIVEGVNFITKHMRPDATRWCCSDRRYSAPV